MMRKTALALPVFLLAIGLGGGYLLGEANAERQPRMRAALRALKLAERELEGATADKGGHRVKAIELTRQAMAEVEAGIAYDDAH